MITRLIISALAVLITSLTLDGVTVDPWWWAVIIAIVLGLINSWIRPLVKLFALPINILTLGLFTFVIKAGRSALPGAEHLVGYGIQCGTHVGELVAAPVLPVKELSVTRPQT